MVVILNKNELMGERLNMGRKGNCVASLLFSQGRTGTARAFNGCVDCSYFYTATIFMGKRFQVQMKVQSHLLPIDRKEPPDRFRLLFFVGIGTFSGFPYDFSSTGSLENDLRPEYVLTTVDF